MEILFIEGSKVQREGGRVRRAEARLEDLPAFRTVRGWPDAWDEEGTLLVAERVLRVEWPVYLAITVDKLWMGKSWHVVLHAVAPKAASPAVLDAACSLQGIVLEELAPKDRVGAAVTSLLHYGASATLSEFFSENARSAVLAAQVEAQNVIKDLSPYLNSPVNALGHTGWDFLRGY